MSYLLVHSFQFLQTIKKQDMFPDVSFERVGRYRYIFYLFYLSKIDFFFCWIVFLTKVFFSFCAIEDMNQIELDPRTMTKEGLTQFKQVSKYYMWILDSNGLVNLCNGNYLICQ